MSEGYKEGRKPVFILWEVRVEKDEQRLGIRGIFTEEKFAERAKKGLEEWYAGFMGKGEGKIPKRFVIEEIELNHLFGFRDIKGCL